MIEDLAKFLSKHLKLSETDALVAALFAVGGFSVDAVFFAGGIPPGTVTLLSGTSGYAGSRLFRGSSFFRAMVLRRIRKLVDEGIISEEDGDEVTKKIFDSWTAQYDGSQEPGFKTGNNDDTV